MDLFVCVKLGFLLVLIASFFSVSVGQSEEDEAGFNRFLVKAQHEFYNWTIATGRDPMRLNTTISFASDLMYVNASMKNHAVYGFPHISPPITIYSSLANGSIRALASSPTRGSDGAVEGDYEISGFYNRTMDIPIEGSGRFNTTGNSAASAIIFNFHNFTVVNDHIDLTDAIFALESGAMGNLWFRFDGLNASGYERDVNLLVGWEYSVLLIETQEFKDTFLKTVKEYYSEVFANNPVSDMVRTP